nr:anti-sigma factor [uncultured Undibacterium sp.]
MNIQHNKRLQHKLAAEYVLGTLRGGARRRFHSWLINDPHLQQVVREWEQHLMPMMEFSRKQVPQAQVWRNIEQQLKLGAMQSKNVLFDFLESLNFWRSFSLIASTALILLAVFVIKPLEPSIAPDLYVATLSDEQARPIAVISSDVKHHQILLRFVDKPVLAADKSLELWSISKEGKIRSLGVISDTAENNVLRITLPAEVNSDTPQLLAISLEPKGGSSNPEKPSGPILFKGNWLKTA